ncbi:MAG TPA: MBL fold metallo-hydrolase [Vicinamibacterales bacterium]|nr:MBL fold metallo-hydrolase [Vicinamibacterales bacterium]
MTLDRRRFLGTVSAALAGSALDVRTLLAQAAAEAPKTAFRPVRRSVGIFTGQGGTIGWHIDTKGAVVVDSQFPTTARICLEGVTERAGGRMLDYLVNTHHHSDHVAGNVVFQPRARKILAHANVPKLQKEASERGRPPGADAGIQQVYPTATYQDAWHETVGDEEMDLRYYGPAHTGGDSVITFEKANVVHLGDLLFNRMHPFIDRPAGASIANWMKVLERTAADHDDDTIYIFGHANPKFGETGRKGDLLVMGDYLAALLEFVSGQMKAGKPREAILAITDPLRGFPDHGPLVQRTLAPAYDELAASRP